jgi:hypothetical protein
MEEAMNRIPPIPPSNRSNKGPGEPDHRKQDGTSDQKSQKGNPESRGDQGNTKINTTHQGYQQDR